MSDELELFDEDTEDTQKDKFLTFSIEQEVYGLDISHVTEIIGIQEITQIPEQLPCIRGVINLRGKIIPTMDIRLRFGKAPREYDDRTCIVVLELLELTVGIIVDRVVEVTCIPEEEISQPPTFGNGSGRQFVRGIGKAEDSVKLILDTERLLTHGNLMMNWENMNSNETVRH